MSQISWFQNVSDAYASKQSMICKEEHAEYIEDILYECLQPQISYDRMALNKFDYYYY